MCIQMAFSEIVTLLQELWTLILENRRFTWSWVQRQDSYCKHLMPTFFCCYFHFKLKVSLYETVIVKYEGFGEGGSTAFLLRAQKLVKRKILCYHWVGERSHGVTRRSGGSQAIYVHASSPQHHYGLLSAQTSCGLLSQ